MKKNIPFIVLGTALLLSLLVLVRMQGAGDVLSSETQSAYTRPSEEYTIPRQQVTVKLTDNNGYLVIPTREELLIKVKSIKQGDTPEDLKAIFGKFPKGFEDENGEITELVYYTGLMEIRIEGNPVEAVKLVDTENNDEVLYDSRSQEAQTDAEP